MGVVMLASLSAVGAQRALAEGELPFPPEAHSLETLERSVTAVYAGADRLLVLPFRKNFGLFVPFRAAELHAKSASASAHAKGQVSSPITRASVFGQLTDGQRLPILADQDLAPDWRGVDEILPEATDAHLHPAAKLLLVGGEDFMLVEADASTLKEITRRVVPRDLIKPARDPRGEPTAPVIASLRRSFSKAWGATPGIRVAGLARIPISWKLGHDKRRYLAALRVPKYPLVMVECDLVEPSSCLIARHCNLEGAADLEPISISGIGLSQQDGKRLAVIGDARQHRLHIFNFQSCYHVPRIATLKLPARLRPPTNIHVDQSNGLWITTRRPDDYLNASLYFWPRDAWNSR